MGGCCKKEYSEVADVRSVAYPDLRARLPRMDGKVVAVTGCTTGTGFICAKTCAELGAHVVMLNRPSDRANAALASIQAEIPGCRVTGIPCDLLHFDAVREAGARLRKELAGTGLDVLCNNAGIMATKDEATADGYDTQMQTNHFSHFLLAAEVWPLLEQAASKNGEARVVNHSSGARYYPYKKLEARFLGKNGGNLDGDQNCAPFTGPRWTRYQQSKLANVVFTYALDDKIKAKGSKVKSLVAHPGLASTNLQVKAAGDGGMAGGFANCLMGNFAQSGEDGTVPLLTCCCVQGVASREFYGPKWCMARGPAVRACEEGRLADEASRTLLWDESVKATGAKFDL